jgi:hypothetical protein
VLFLRVGDFLLRTTERLIGGTFMLLVVFILFFIGTLKVSKALRQERRFFVQYGTGGLQHALLCLFVWLYIIPPYLIAFFILPGYYLILPFPLTVFLYIPAIIIGRRNIRKFETCGIERAKKSSWRAVMLGYGGIIYVLVYYCIITGSDSII